MRLKGKLLIMFCLTALLCLFAGTAVLADTEADFSRGIEAAVNAYLEENGISPEIMGIGWYDITSGESWFLNGDEFMRAGSMYKLPLNMVYTDMLSDGRVQPDDMVGDYTVETAMRLSIVYSDNDAAKALRKGMGLTKKDYRDRLAQYSGLDIDSLPDTYYTENRMSPRFLINTLLELYENSEHYAVLIDRMKEAMPELLFKKYEKELDCEIAHKYGSFEGTLSDCGIFYTSRPFLLVIMTDHLSYAEKHLAQLAYLFADYSEYLDEQDRIAAEREAERIAEEKAAEELRARAEEAERIAAEKAREAEAALKNAEAERQEAEKRAAEHEAELKAQEEQKERKVIIAAAAALLLAVSTILPLTIRHRKYR